jgi:ABC-type lipoprotein release transport system permease subunit
MMPPRNLVTMIVKNTVRSPKHFALSAFGIVIGISAFVFFVALALGVSSVILEIFPLDVVEVTAPRASFAGKDTTIPLTDDTVAMLKRHPDVKDALPRMRAEFPAQGSGTFEGEEINFEVGGFTDGIDPSYVADDAKLAEQFRDWDVEQPDRPACIPAVFGSVLFGNPKIKACADKTHYYCDETDRTCHHRVPVIVSRAVLELYNGQVAVSHGLPVIPDIDDYIIEHAGDRLRFTIALCETMVTGSSCQTDAEPRRVEGQLVGISPKAMPIGMTIPIGYVRRWNQEFAGEEAATSYSSIIVTLRDKNRLAPFTSWLEDDAGGGPGLRLQDPIGEKFATAIFIVTTLFVFISFTIVGISSINIAHNFFMQISDRRREIGLLRAVGATRTDVKLIILGEAALIGITGGLLGIGLALLGGQVVDWASAHYLPRFPFKPATYFDFQPWIVGLGLLFSTVFCVLGGFLPARKASRLAPAQALAQN